MIPITKQSRETRGWRQRIGGVSLGLLLWFCLSITALYAQSGAPLAAPPPVTLPIAPAPPRFTQLTINEGLSHNAVTAILQDRRGFLWFGTRDGLNRFDGYTIVTYRHDPQNPNSLSRNAINTLYEDQAGLLWIATGDGGVTRFDPLTEQFTHFRYTPGNPNALGGNVIFAITQDRASQLWFGGPSISGLTRYDPATDRFTQSHNAPPTNGERPAPYPLGAIHAMQVDAQGELWVLTETTFSRYDPVAAGFTVYALPPGSARTPGLRTFLRDEQGGFWIGGAMGLLHFDPTTAQFTPVTASPLGIAALLRDDQGQIWIGAAAGLYRFAGLTQSFYPFGQQSNTTDAPAIRGPVLSLYQDQGGQLWVGTAAGVYRYDPRQRQFQRYTFPTDESPLAEPQAVVALAGAADDELWVATATGLQHLHLGQGTEASTVTRYPLPASTGPSTTEPPAHRISRLFQDRRGQLWLGLPEERLLAFDPQEATFTEYILADRGPQPGPPPMVSGFYEDDAENLWVAVAWVGLYRLDPTRTQIKYFGYAGRPDYFADSPDQLASSTLMAITGDTAGNLWLGHHDGTLSRFTPQTGQFHHYPSQGVLTGAQPRPPDGPPPACAECPPPPAGAPPPDAPPSSGERAPRLPLVAPGGDGPRPPALNTPTAAALAAANPSGWIETLYWDADASQLWIGEHNGLVRFDPATEHFTHYGSAEGLTNSYIVSIAQEQTGRLWLGTQFGLISFEPTTERFSTYDQTDGLQDPIFQPQASWRGADGRLFFGSASGLTSFRPDDLVEPPVNLPVRLTAMRLFNLPVAVSPTTPLPRAMWALDQVTLQPDQTVVAFEFATLNFAAPHQNRYRYRLDPLESAWNEVDSNRRFATYTHLPPATYTLRIQGGNRNGVWQTPETTLYVTVLPYWWQTLWFRTLIGIGLLGAVLGGYRWRLYTIERRNQELAAEVAKQTAALRDSEARFRGLATAAFEAIVLHQAGTMIDANDAALALFGYPHSALVGQPIHHILTLRQPDDGKSTDEPAQRGGVEAIGQRADGTTLEVEIHLGTVPYGDATATVVALRDLTDRKAAEQQAQRLAALEERERIGRDLHDDLGQVIGYINLQAQTARALLEQAHPAQAQATLTQLIDVAQAAHNDVRHYILGIRTQQPPTPALDLFTALDLYLAQIRERHGLQVQVSLPDELPEPLLAPQVETQLLRIIQEALTNIRKHAGVARAHLLFALHADELQVIISDEGRGFVMAAQEMVAAAAGESPSPRPDLHFGLAIMRERAAGVGGRLEIRTAPGEGTQLIVTLPRILALSAVEDLQGLRVLIADDHPLYREGLRNMLSARGLHVVAIAEDGEAAVRLAHQFLPDLILMDIEMPNGNGITATKAIKRALPTIKIVMLTVAASEELLLTALKSGAAGYLLKNLATDQFFTLLREVMLGETVLSPKLTTAMVSTLLTPEASTPPSNGTPAEAATTPAGSSDHTATTVRIAQLTTRQQEVLFLVVQGLTNKEIARKLHITERTVKYHIGLILEQMAVQNRYDLIRLAQHMAAPTAASVGQ